MVTVSTIQNVQSNNAVSSGSLPVAVKVSSAQSFKAGKKQDTENHSLSYYKNDIHEDELVKKNGNYR